MAISTMKRARRLTVVAVFAIVAVAAFGFAAANTVPASKAGDGHGAVSGYTASGVHYNLNATNPGNIDSVQFTLDSTPVAGSTITVKLVAAGSTWYSCTNVGPAVTCTTTGATVLTADDLRVVVAD
ncbi:MAG: hypothetical protein HS107_13480 [Thermoflexaceae bacterium]|nr:hypothetical protein [Thermoflexaceae bacterium]